MPGKYSYMRNLIRYRADIILLSNQLQLHMYYVQQPVYCCWLSHLFN